MNVSYDNSFTAIKRDIQQTVDKSAKAKEAPLGPIAEVPGPKKGPRMTGNFGISPRVPKKEDDRKEKLNQSQPVKLKDELLGREKEGRPQVRPKVPPAPVRSSQP